MDIIQNSQMKRARSWRRRLLTTVAEPMLTGDAKSLTGSTWGYQKLRTREDSNSNISRLSLAERIWLIFHGCSLHEQLCYSSQMQSPVKFTRKKKRLIKLAH